MARVLVPSDETVVRLAAGFVSVVAPAFGVIGAQQVLAGAFRGAGQTLQAMALSLLMQWALQIPISYILARHTMLGLAGVWWGFPIANSGRAAGDGPVVSAQRVARAGAEREGLTLSGSRYA